MFPDIWYIEALPIERITMVQEETQMPDWLVSLKDDIAKRGMLSPLLVMNREDNPYWMRHGNNRLQCLKMLKWTHAPALCFGLPPDEDLKPVKLLSLSECQSYLKDGTIGYHNLNYRDTFKIMDCKVPQHCKYPEDK